MNQKNYVTQNRVFTLLFLIASFLYIIVVINPVLWFHKIQPTFLVTSDFLLTYLKSPGGFSTWLANFFMQSFYYPVAGVVVLFVLAVVLARLIFVSLQWFHKSPLNPILALLPLFLALSQSSNYNFPISVVISLILVVTMLLPILKIKNQFYFLIYFLLAAILIYYLSGIGFLLVFSCSVFLWILKQSSSIKRLNLFYIIIITYLIIWISGSYIFENTEKLSFFNFTTTEYNLTGYKSNIIFYLYLFYLPLLFGSISIGQYLGIEHLNTKKATVLKYSLAVAIVLTGIVSHSISFDPEAKKIVASNYYSYHNDPKRTAEVSMSLRNYSFVANINYNLAICKTGKLSEEFFNFFQISGANALYPDYHSSSDAELLAIDFYYQLGDILEAKYWALEALKKYPYSRRLLKTLAKIELITGNFNDAKKYLNILNLEFFNQDFVKKYQPYLNNTTLIQSDQEIMQKRSFVPGFTEVPETPLLRFEGLLDTNPKNKTAFECMMLYYMLIGDLKGFSEHYKQIRNYFSHPVEIYEEAILMYGATNNIPVADDYNISDVSINRLKRFADALAKRGDNDRLAMNELYSEFGKTYFYYHYFVLPQITIPEYAEKELDQDQQ